MLGQKSSSTNKFAETQPPMSQLILKRGNVAKPHVNLILNQEMQVSKIFQDSVIDDICLFSVCENGYYHISSQVCIKNENPTELLCDYVQFGLVEKEKLMENCKEHMKSTICNTKIEPEYFISDDLSCVMRLEKDIQYCMWLNVGTPDKSLSYQSENSHLRLYKL